MPVQTLFRMLFTKNSKTCLQEEVLFQERSSHLSVKSVQEKYSELLRVIDKQSETSLTLREHFFLTQYHKSYQNEINGLSLRGLAKTSGAKF
jgi:hypothetical protein